jgi:hypothetical protein
VARQPDATGGGFEGGIENCSNMKVANRVPSPGRATTFPTNLPLSRPEATLSPSDGGRDGVRGSSAVPSFCNSFWSDGVV